MPDWSIDFDAPQYLILLTLLPIFWLVGRRSLQTLGSWRRRTAMILRLTVAALLILALAEPNWLTLVRRLTVLFLVDASDSIQRDELAHALEYVNSAAQQRNTERGDRAGVVVFGRRAGVEIPPIDQPWRLARIESDYDPQFTNLEAALQLAEATFPPDSAKRLVIVSDGNENLGRAEPQAAKLLESGVGIDCMPISYQRRGEVVVEKVAAPTDIRRGTPFALRIVLNNISERPVTGKLRITRKLDGAKHLVADESVTLDPGKRVLTLRQEPGEAGMATYEARFLPGDPTGDTHSANNVATAFCRVSGRGHVLVIEDASQAGRFDKFIQLLRENDIEVTLRDTRRSFDNLADLQQFDSVILADVARVAGDGAADLTQFSDQQIHELVQNTEHFGCGLVVLGGPNSYGAGGWTNTELEKALPVDFQIESAKVNAVGALMLVIDSSGSMTGEKIAWSKAAAIAAAKMLGPRDFIGVVSFDSEAHWTVPLQRNGAQNRTLARIGRLAAGGGTNIMPGLKEAYRAIQAAEASLKHVIVLTDGQTPKENYESLVTGMLRRGITTSGVAVGPDADRQLLADISRRGGGKFYHVLSPKAIPRIFMREARRVAMPLVFEDKNGIAAQIVTPGELLSGINEPPPPVSGYVLTTIKQDPLVEVLMATPRQPQPQSTILATRQYGLGRTIALTTDLGHRWATEWPAWENYDKLMLQLARWSMRSHVLNEQLAMSTEARDGSIQVVINALDHDDAHLNLVNLFGTAVLPNGESQDFSLEQIGPGRYVAQVPADVPGNYYLTVSGGGRTAPLRSAVNVSTTAELDRLFSYEEFLAQLAEAAPKDGEPGRMIQSPRGIADTQGLLRTDVFRAGLTPATSRNMSWPLMLLVASVAFLVDVFCRRVLMTFDWLPQVFNWLPFMRRPATASLDRPRMDRLRQSKASATAQFGAARLEQSTVVGEELSAGASAVAADREETDESLPTSAPADKETMPAEFTARLLEAKKRVRESQQRPDSG